MSSPVAEVIRKTFRIPQAAFGVARFHIRIDARQELMVFGMASLHAAERLFVRFIALSSDRK